MSLFTKNKFIKDVTPSDFQTVNGKLKLKKFNDCMVVVTAEWCGHCKNLKPELEAIGKVYGNSFPILNIDSENEKNKKIISQLKVEGFPTIFFVKYGFIKEKYEGDRSATEISKKICEFTRNGTCFKI